MDNIFLQKVSEQIVDEKSRNLITAELESHLLDKIDYYTDIGYSKEEAEKRATDEMGSPDDTAVPLNALNRKKHRAVPIIICACLLLLMFIFSYLCCDSFRYLFSMIEFPHKLRLDLISLGYITAYAVMLIYAHKKSEKIIPVLIVISFCLQLIAPYITDIYYGGYGDEPLNMFYVYQPFFYSVIKIFTEGFPAYIKCLFTSAPVRYNEFSVFCYKAMPYILCAIFILWSVILFISIWRKERMLNTKKENLYLKIPERTVSIITALNLIIMSCSIAFVSLKDLFSGNTFSANKQSMIDYVLNVDLKNNLSDLADSTEEEGYYLYDKNFDEENKYCDYYDKGGTFVLSSFFYERDNGEDGEYTSIRYDDNYYLPYDSSPEILSDMEKIKQIDKGTTFEYIVNSGLLKYTNYIKKHTTRMITKQNLKSVL